LLHPQDTLFNITPALYLSSAGRGGIQKNVKNMLKNQKSIFQDGIIWAMA